MWTERRNIVSISAQLPTVIWLNGTFHLYYAWRIKNISRIGRIILDNNLRIIDIEPEMLSPGHNDCFDSHGVMPSYVETANNGQVRLYYTGWRLDRHAPYRHAIGTAVSHNHKLERESESPIIDSTEKNNYIANSPYMLTHDRMLYCKGKSWCGDFATYGISEATRALNGHWEDGSSIFGLPGEANSRPCVLHGISSNLILSAFRTKTTGYRIRMFDGGKLVNDDVLPVSLTGWDSQMVCYPQTIHTPDGILLFYNGNNYGETGIGVAELQHTTPYKSL